MSLNLKLDIRTVTQLENVHTSLSLKVMYAQSSSVFSWFLLLTTPISGPSAAMYSPLFRYHVTVCYH
ncbi:hypothetical protein RO3G_06453 [Rhizopus delemar RA 99-880]|uniref:Uncharacterized protein n=1 Tax=Rhizopus delemar (strain RA 99-880 / ATCC MYA-4621 / FGSC 9543 / NRRL 43880) TaxID=246409 RepID=I1BZW8_RHIO9|nr:hypothetical protein RO3G_06453 [Rhizopus delemar RA 99-880]|eukprot:EIE81748.1 hypothetical protein RO3G_06453 [Rhizopus delemar RA 99-880]